MGRFARNLMARASGGSTIQRQDQLGAVDRMDQVDIRRQRVGLVGLQLADEVHPKARTHLSWQSGNLG